MDNLTEGEKLCKLAYAYIKGQSGIEIDEELGGRLLMQSAELGYPAAMGNVGSFSFGNPDGTPIYGLPIDYDAGIHWLTRAINEGDNEVKAGALTSLGLSYLEGKGVPQDDGKAFELIQEAAALGNSEARYILSNFF